MLGVRPLRPELRLAGQAFTLRYIPVREDLERPGEFDNRTNKQRIAVESVGPGGATVPIGICRRRSWRSAEFCS